MLGANAWKLIALVAAIGLGSCSYEVETATGTHDPDLTPTPEYDGLKRVPGLDWYELSQGWNSEIRRAYWFTPQGSLLVPYDWFLNLEMPERSCRGVPDASLNKGGWKMFGDPGHMRSLGYIPAPSDPKWNPDGLPIGFANTPTAEGNFMGPTCAACHTNLMVLNRRKVLVEGAPTLADLQGLNEGLANALCSIDPSSVSSRKNANPDAVRGAARDQFTRFAKRVLKDGYSEETAAKLLERVTKQRLRIQRRNARNYSQRTEVFPPYGKGRLDALGAILNEVAATKARVRDNAYPANAPVSYPFLWGTPQSDVVQWNGAVDNQSFGLGPLGRNVGEVVGVYGHVKVFPTDEGQAFLDRRNIKAEHFVPDLIEERGTKWLGYESSVMMPNLGSIERWISMLRSPKWPQEALGEIDSAKVDVGRELYLGKAEGGRRSQVKCVGCHRLVKREDQDKPYQSTMVRVSEIGTDPATANNFLLEANPTNRKPWATGQYEGTKRGILTGKRYGKYFVYRGEAMATVVVGVIFGDLFFDGLIAAYRSRSVSEKTEHINVADKLFRYKARPLTGIWATAPYLHNGSVPNLRALLTPEDDRPTKFCVGNREFDATNLGFKSDTNPDGTCAGDEYGATLLDTSKFGNSNKGHSSVRHGVELSDTDKEALIEFLKTL